MINYIKKLYSDWIILRTIRRNLDVLDPIENQELIRYVVNRYSEKDEKSINDLMCNSLTRELVQWNISPEQYRWYILAISHRYMIFQNNRKLLNKK